MRCRRPTWRPSGLTPAATALTRGVMVRQLTGTPRADRFILGGPTGGFMDRNLILADMRASMFGAELSDRHDYAGRLLDELERVRSAAAEAVASLAAAKRGDLAQEVAAPSLRRIDELRSELLRAPVPSLTSPLRIVMVGRTMVGKSTLMDYLTGGDGRGIGQGAQRMTRDVVDVDLRPGIVLVDTPGVGAESAQADHDAAIAACSSGDLIVWVQDTDALHEAAARALREICGLGTPVVVVLNCKSVVSLASLRTVQRDIASAFEEADRHVPRLLRVMQENGREPLHVYRVHMAALNLARVLEQEGVSDEVVQLCAARLDPAAVGSVAEITVLSDPSLVGVIRGESAGADLDDLYSLSGVLNPRSIRFARMTGVVRTCMQSLDTSVMVASRDMAAAAQALDQQSDDLRNRVHEVLEDVRLSVAAELETRKTGFLGANARWVDEHIEDDDFKKRANDKLKSLASGFQKDLDAGRADLEQGVGEAMAGWQKDWTEIGDTRIRAGRTTTNHVTGLLNQRFAKLGVGLASTLAFALLGSGPLGWAAVAVGVAVSWLVGKLIPGSRDKRQAHVRKATKEMRKAVDETAHNASVALEGMLKSVKDEVDASIARMVKASKQVGYLARACERRSGDLDRFQRDADKALYEALLSEQGRFRLARGLVDVTRIPGSVALCRYRSDRTFDEASLFPPRFPVELHIPIPGDPGATPLRTAAHALRLGRWPDATVCERDGRLYIYGQGSDLTDTLQREGTVVALTRKLTGLQACAVTREGSTSDA